MLVAFAGSLRGMQCCRSASPVGDATTSAVITTLAVGPVQMPEYVDRLQIVTQESQHRYQLAEFDQWAEAIEDNLSRVLLDNLSNLLSPVQIAVILWQSDLPTTYRAQVDVTRFSGAAGEEAAPSP